MPASPISYVPFLSGQQNSDLMAAQQQQAMAQAILGEGLSPVSTEGRSIGGVGYAISPLEGAAKLGNILSGKYQQSVANDKLAAALSGVSNQGAASDAPSADTAISKMPPDLQQLFRMWSLPESMGGNPRAAAELVSKFAGPTEQQKNFAQMPGAMGNFVTNQTNPLATGTINGQEGLYPTDVLRGAATGAAPQMSPQPPITPAQGPQTLPSQQGSLPNPPPATAFPPPQGAPAIPPVNASVLMPPTPSYGKTVLTPQQQAALDVQKAGQVAQAEVQPAGAKTEAEDTGKNLADATKTFNVAAASLPRAMQRFGQLRDAAKNASYGGGVDEEDPGSHLGDYSRNFARSFIGQQIEPKTATSNQIMEQATKQGILSELGPQLAGLRGNKFLESIASGASGLNLADPPPAKINAINGLQDQYISNLKSLVQQRRQYGDTSVPTDMDLAKMIAQNADPATTVSVISPDGKLGRVSPLHLTDLIQAGGQIR